MQILSAFWISYEAHFFLASFAICLPTNCFGCTCGFHIFKEKQIVANGADTEKVIVLNFSLDLIQASTFPVEVILRLLQKKKKFSSFCGAKKSSSWRKVCGSHYGFYPFFSFFLHLFPPFLMLRAFFKLFCPICPTRLSWAGRPNLCKQWSGFREYRLRALLLMANILVSRV